MTKFYKIKNGIIFEGENDNIQLIDETGWTDATQTEIDNLFTLPKLKQEAIDVRLKFLGEMAIEQLNHVSLVVKSNNATITDGNNTQYGNPQTELWEKAWTDILNIQACTTLTEFTQLEFLFTPA